MNQLKLWIVIITLSLTVGSSFIAIKIVLDSIPPLFAFSIRFMITGGVLILVSYIFDRKSQEIKKIKLWRNALFIGAFLILGGHGLIAYGAQYPLCRNCLVTEFNNSFVGSIIYVPNI